MRSLLGAILAVICLIQPAAADTRVALVIGNGAYQSVTELPNPGNDARAMAAKLKGLGFEVIEGYDLDVFSMQMKIRDFARAARTADTNLFFYAGHGLGIGGKNYLVPVDARFEDPAALEFETVEVDTVLRQMQVANGVSLVFLDACRDDPGMVNKVARSMSTSTRSVSLGQGLAAIDIVEPGRGTAIAFATSPGDVAYDGDGQHSPFTAALLNHIDRPNTSISEIMAHVTGEVRAATNDQQKPWLNASLTGPVVLNQVAAPQAPAKAKGQPAAKAAPVTDLEAQKALYGIAVDTDRVEDYRAYLTMFPDGLFAVNARQSIERLEAAASAQAQRTLAAQEAAAAEPTGPLVLTATDHMKALPATQATEAALGLDWAKRREVQARLNLAGFNVGTADGAIGPKTRRGLSEWQVSKGLQPTGHLNNVQLQLLSADTETAWLAWSAANPAQQRTSSSSGSRSSSSSSRSSGGIDPGAAIAIGIGAAILGKALR